MPDVLIQLGVIVALLCLFVAALDRKDSRSNREREYRMQMMIDEWKRDHPDL